MSRGQACISGASLALRIHRCQHATGVGRVASLKFHDTVQYHSQMFQHTFSFRIQHSKICPPTMPQNSQPCQVFSLYSTSRANGSGFFYQRLVARPRNNILDNILRPSGVNTTIVLNQHFLHWLSGINTALGWFNPHVDTVASN